MAFIITFKGHSYIGEDLMDPKMMIELDPAHPPIDPFSKSYNVLDEQEEDEEEEINYEILELPLDFSDEEKEEEKEAVSEITEEEI